MLNYVLSSLKKHSKRRYNWYIFNKNIEKTLNNNFFTESEKTIH